MPRVGSDIVNKPVPSEPRSNQTTRNTTLIAVVAVVAVLYFARIVLIPFALAILISFILTPLVIRMRRWGLGRIPSVLMVVTFTTVLLVLISGLVWGQLADLTQKLPEYQQTIQEKVRSLRDSGGGTLDRLTRGVNDFSEALTPEMPASSDPNEEKPLPVEVRRSAFSPLEIVRGIAGSIIHVALLLGIVVVFVLFMLFQREDLRDRLLRLVGTGRLNATTLALDEAAQRVSRFLVAQLLVNAVFGVLAWLTLMLLGVPNPVLWGVIAALLRYIPYLGMWLAAAMPAALAFAVTPGWFVPVAIAVSYLAIDLFIINLLEPLVYGTSTGISPMAILVAAVFWTWLWGPVGLLLATPLTVCLVVLGRYVPALEFLDVLLGDKPVLTPEKKLYQRLLARDIEEATEVAEEFLKDRSLEEMYETVLIPALWLAEEDRHRGRMDEAQEEFVLENARILTDDVADLADEIIAAKKKHEAAETVLQSGPQPEPARESGGTVLCLPARDDADEIGAMMLAHLLKRRGVTAKTMSASALAAERLELVAQENAKVVCVCAVPPLGNMHVRYLCKRLRSEFPDVKIVAAVFRPGKGDIRRDFRIPADETASTLNQAVASVLSLIPATRPTVEQAVLIS